MSRKLRFRPTVENLEGRRLMAGDVGAVEQGGGGVFNDGGLPSFQDGTSNTIMVGEFYTRTPSTRINGGGLHTSERATRDTDEFFAELGNDTATDWYIGWIEVNSATQTVAN